MGVYSSLAIPRLAIVAMKTPRTFLLFILIAVIVLITVLTYSTKSSIKYQQQSSQQVHIYVPSALNFGFLPGVGDTDKELHLESSQNVSKTNSESKRIVSEEDKKGKQKKTTERDNKPHSKPQLQNNDDLFQTTFPPPTLANGYTCRNSMCSEFLSPQDMKAFTLCTKNSKKLKPPLSFNGPCHFMNGTNRSPVALASLPGSGNTWVRGLLELATGVCTGAMYSDKNLRMGGFNGESVKSGAVLVVKTHAPLFYKEKLRWADPSNPKSSGYGGAILIVRNPLDALVAEWTRTHSKLNHTGVNFNIQIFGDNPNWNGFVNNYIKKWKSYFHAWVVNATLHPTMVIRYEDLKSDLVKSVERMLDYLKFPYTNEELKERLSKDFSAFQRKHKEVDFEHFTAEQKEVVRTNILEVVTYLQTQNNGDTLGIEEYVSQSN